MVASDFILKTRADLQEKSEHWKSEELLGKLQRCYISLQFDLPFFITSVELAIKKDKSEYYLDNVGLKDISLKIDNVEFKYTELEHFYSRPTEPLYAFNENRVLINQTPTADAIGTLIYKYQKEIATANCEIEIPLNWHRALRYLFLSDIHEKPTRNTKERDLSVHYLKLYKQEIRELKINKKARPKNITSKYQRI